MNTPFGSPTFWRYLRYARPYWKQVLGSIICGLLKFALGLLLPYALGQLTDHVILADLSLAEKQTQLLWVTAILVVSYVVRIPIAYYRSYLAEYAGNRTIFDIREALYAHVQRLGLEYHARTRAGGTVSRLVNDINTVQGILDRGVMSIAVDAMFLAGTVVFLVAWDWKLALVSLFTLPAYGYVFRLFYPRLRVASLEVQSTTSDMSSELSEKIVGHPVVLAFARERSERLHFFREHRRYFNAVMKRVWLQVWMFQLGDFFTMIGPLVVLAFGTWQVIHGRLSLGELLVFNGFLAHLFIPTRRLADASAALQMNLAAMDRVFEVMDIQPEIQDKPGAPALNLSAGRIEIENVSFHYRPELPVLRGIDLTVEPGEAVAIVGRSGAGKSTLIKLVPRFYDVIAGAIRIDGQDIRDVRQETLRMQIGMVLQDPILFNGSVRDNILYGRRHATEDEMRAAARMAHVDEFVGELPEGYDTIIGERGVTLSGGQKQRVSIARAFLRNPRILILDEATSSLDSHAEAIIQDALLKLMKGRTTLVIAHRLSTIIDCDRVVYMEDGHIVQSGPHLQLIQEPGPYRALCEEQFGDVHLDALG
jgi:subfamily B ATP-binding cassette protein MsbA